MENECVASGDLLEQVDVVGDEVGFGDEADAKALLFGEDFEDAVGDADAALDGLVGIGGGADGYFIGWIYVAELLFEEPCGVLFEVDFVLEGEGPELLGDVVGAGRWSGDGGGLEKLVGIAGVAVFAAELAAAEGVDGPGDGELSLGDGFVKDGAGGDGAEFDEVAVVGVGGIGGEAGEAGGARVEDGEEGGGFGF